MKLLSDDDLDIAALSSEELAAAWDLWFDLAQSTNDDDPPYAHGVFAGLRQEDLFPQAESVAAAPGAASLPERSRARRRLLESGEAK